MNRPHLLATVFLLSGLLILGACASSSTDPSPDLFSIAAASTGAHISLVDEPPPGFHLQSLAQVYAQHQAGEPIWLHAPQTVLVQMDTGEEFLTWLQTVQALHFLHDGQELYWIPPSPAADSLAFAEQQHLTAWIEPRQQASLWIKRGDQQRTDNDFADSIRSYQKALSLGAETVELYAGLGAAYLGLGKNEEAAVALERAVILAPDDYWAHRLLGNAYLKLQRYNLALDELTQAYIIRPNDTHILLGVALAQGRSGHVAEALRTLQQLQARSENPHDLADADKLRQEFLSAQTTD